MTRQPSAELRRIGLTGGIGSGKSSVAAILRARGVRVIDLDQHSRAVLDVPGAGVEAAIERFGEEYRSDAGRIDRHALADLVFSDPLARRDLERIVLARVDEAVAREEADAVGAGERLIVHDSPLLLEKDRDADYDAVVAVLAPREQRIARIVENRGRSREYAESVMAAQASDLDRIRRADRLILNNGDRTVLERRSLAALEQVSALPSTHSQEDA